MKTGHRYTSFLLLFLIALFLPFGLPAQHANKSDADEGETDISSIDKMINLLRPDSLSLEESFPIACKTLKLSVEAFYTRGKAESYLQIGRYFLHKRKHPSAVHFLLCASQLFNSLKDTAGMLRVDHSLFSVEIYVKDYENSLSTCEQGLELARKKKDLKLSGFFLEKMADVFHEQKDTSKSLDYYMESLKYYTEARDRKSVLGVYMSIGSIYLDQKRYSDVISMYDTLIVFADSVDPASAGTMYTRMAHVYEQQNNFSKAVFYNRKALEARSRAKIADVVNSSIINLAGSYFKMNRPDSGWYYMDIGLRDAKLNNRFYYLRNAYTLLYHYYLKKGDMEKALENFRQMVSVNDSIQKERLNTDINVIRSGQNVMALKESIRLLENQNVLQKVLIRNQKIFKFLLIAIVLAVMLAVSIIVRINMRHRRSKRNIENLNIKLQYEAAERKLVQKKTVEKEDQYRFLAEHSLDLISRINKDYNFTYASPAAAEIFGYTFQDLLSVNLFDIVVAGHDDFLKEQLAEVVHTRRPHSIAFLARKKGNEPIWVESTFNPVFNPKTGDFREFVSVTRNIQELKKREMGIVEGTKQKENLLREIHHRVKNNFAILVSLINMQKAQSQNEDVRQSLTNLQLRIRTMALVHEMLYRSEDFEKISFPDYIRSVASVISATYGRMNVHLDFQLEPVIINIETAIPLGLILNELLSNAYRHAFAGDSEGNIMVTFKKQETPNLYALIVSDSGTGLPEGFSMGENKTMGLQIVDILVKQIEAQLQIKQVNGTSFTITFPIEG
ncbi:MAG: PAS domain S-box protein [Bacteroidetes bacterium]|nr:PAS domain S-box protein [Bacteroidota bacterium]